MLLMLLLLISIFLYVIAHKDFGHFYGSSYVAAPDGSRTPVSLFWGEHQRWVQINIHMIEYKYYS